MTTSEPDRCFIYTPHNRHGACDGAGVQSSTTFCASSPEAQALPEDDFWEAVFSRHMVDGEHTENCEPEADLYWVEGDDVPTSLRVLSSHPCRECGESGPCGYDAEGRAMVHVEQDDGEET